jgi:hypothetical protein
MEKPELELKIQMLGNLLDQLNYYSDMEFDGIEEVEADFDAVVAALKELRELLLGELDEYFADRKANNEPIYLPYWTIRKELREATFEV